MMSNTHQRPSEALRARLESLRVAEVLAGARGASQDRRELLKEIDDILLTLKDRSDTLRPNDCPFDDCTHWAAHT